MARAVVARKRSVGSRTKVKSGCATCRIRKVKCDENKPFCQKCVNTGRTCDGYASPFRTFTFKPVDDAASSASRFEAGLQPVWPAVAVVTAEDVDLLNRYFSTKTMFNVKLGCEEEARQVLKASLTDKPIQHALLSLRALRNDLEMSRDGRAVVNQTSTYNYGLQQYCMALGGLASKLSAPSSKDLKSVLICCQMFISIEQAQANYAAMAQHMTRGLRIMRECRARTGFISANKSASACSEQVPFVDVFIVKLFAAPCKFAEHRAIGNASRTTSSCVTPLVQKPTESRDFRSIAPNMRTRLKEIAASTLEFLSRLSHVESAENTYRLVLEKATLIDSLELWLIDLDLVQMEIQTLGREPVSLSFMRFFHQTLKTILSGALDSSPDANANLEAENDRLQGIANNLSKNIGANGTWARTNISQKDHFKAS